MSITTEPLAAPSSTPFPARMAASESAESGSIVITTGVFPATSLDEEAGEAPIRRQLLGPLIRRYREPSKNNLPSSGFGPSACP